jgi:hypothetical protein
VILKGGKYIMMKNVTIFTFEEIDAIISNINTMIDDAKDGVCEKFNPKDVCDWLVDDLRKLRNQFE